MLNTCENCTSLFKQGSEVLPTTLLKTQQQFVLLLFWAHLGPDSFPSYHCFPSSCGNLVLGSKFLFCHVRTCQLHLPVSEISIKNRVACFSDSRWGTAWFCILRVWDSSYTRPTEAKRCGNCLNL